MKICNIHLGLLIGLTGLVTFTGCGQQDEPVKETRTVYAMDTVMTVTAYGEGDTAAEAVDAAEAEIERLDSLVSTGITTSEIAEVNRTGSAVVSSDTAEMVQEALTINQMTDGAFDLTIYPVMELWGFPTDTLHVPTEEELQKALQLVHSDTVTLEGDRLTLGEGQEIDLGGIAKGYTSNRIMEIFREKGVTSGLVNLGGNVQCYGSKTDGSDWKLGIQDPLNPDDGTSYLGIVTISDRAVVTSGPYERYYTDEETGETYHHIMDPATGKPADSGLISATIVSENGMLADGLSTACFVMGLDGASDFWREYGEDFDMVLMTEAGEVYVTESLESAFTSDYPVQVIRKE